MNGSYNAGMPFPPSFFSICWPYGKDSKALGDEETKMEGPKVPGSLCGGKLCTDRMPTLEFASFFSFLKPLKLWDLFVIATSINLTNTSTYLYVIQREIYTFFNSGKRRKNIFRRNIFWSSKTVRKEWYCMFWKNVQILGSWITLIFKYILSSRFNTSDICQFICFF